MFLNNLISIIATNHLLNGSTHFLNKFLTKVAGLINENLVDFVDMTVLISSLKKMTNKSFVNPNSSSNDSHFVIIETFMFQIRDYLFEIPKEDILFNVNLLNLVTNRRLKSCITKDDQNLGNIIIKSIITRTGMIKPKKIFQIIRCACFYHELELDQSTLNKLSMIALSNLQKIQSADDLLKVVTFFNKINFENKDKIWDMLRLKLLELIIKGDHKEKLIARCVMLLKPEGDLFSRVYKKYLEVVKLSEEKSLDEAQNLEESSESDTDDEKN
jgi:hypothetical protein